MSAGRSYLTDRIFDYPELPIAPYGARCGLFSTPSWFKILLGALLAGSGLVLFLVPEVIFLLQLSELREFVPILMIVCLVSGNGLFLWGLEQRRRALLAEQFARDRENRPGYFGRG